MLRLVNDPALSEQLEVYPPKELAVDGIARRHNREISPEEAVRFSSRGMRSFVLGWQFGTETSDEEFAEVLRTYARDFLQDGPHPPEASVHVYGRRDPTTRKDTRIVVACIGALAFGGQ